MRNDTLTVAELIAILSKVDPALPVKMAMNQEYECPVEADMVGVREYDEGPVPVSYTHLTLPTILRV